MIRWAVEHRVSTLVGAAALVGLGAFALLRLPVALLPALERPRLVVMAEAPGHSREELVPGLTEPWERRLAGLRDLTGLRSETQDGLVRVSVEADWHADADRLRVDAARLIDGAGEIVPERVEIRLVSGDAAPVIELAVVGGASAVARGLFAEDVLRPELARARGAGQVDVVGASAPRVLVTPRAADLVARGLTAADLEARLADLGRPVSAGRLRDGASLRALVAAERLESMEDLAALELSTAGSTVALGDVVSIRLGEVREQGRFLLDGAPGVLLRAWRAPGANAVALAGEVRAVADRLQRAAPSGLEIRVVDDRSREVVAALSRLALAALAGVLLGTLVLRALLGRWSVTFALACVVPASVLASFFGFHAFGVPLDVVSLAGLTLAAGLLVDNSIVVLEAVENARREGHDAPAVSGTRQVAGAVAAASATTLVVFLPLLYLKGLARAFFGEQAFAVAASLLASLLFSLTLTPVLAGRTKAPARGRHPGRRLYLRMLEASLRRPAAPTMLAVVVVASCLGVLSALPRELLPSGEVRALRVDYRLPALLAPAEAERREDRLLALVRAAAPDAEVSLARGFPELDAVALATDAEPRHGRIELAFLEAAGVRATRDRLAGQLRLVPGIVARVRDRPSAFVEAVAWAGRGFEVVVSASSDPRAEALAGRAADWLAEHAGAVPRRLVEESGGRALFVDWDERRLAALGLDRTALEAAIRPALRRTDLGRVRVAGDDVTLRLEPVATPDLSLLPVGRPPVDEDAERGREARAAPALLLGGLARLEPGSRSALAVREDGRPARRLVLAEGGHRDPLMLGRGLQSVREAHDEHVELAGEAAEFARSFDELELALALAVVLAFVVLAALSESFRVPLLVMTTVPVAAAGGLAALWLTGQSLNLMSFLGLILLAGLVVNSAIVLMHRVDQLRAEGREHRPAILQAASERYRPILMTTATTVFGMLPLALLGGEGAELRRALAIAVLGGLLTSTPAALLLVPALHSVVLRSRRGEPA